MEPIVTLQHNDQSINKRTEPLTPNGFTAAEEIEILQIVDRMHKGEEKIYSAKEAARYLELDD